MTMTRKGCLKKEETTKAVDPACADEIDYAPNNGNVQLPSDLSARVSFGNLTIYDFCVHIGNNPSVTTGAPVCMTRKAWRQRTADIDAYESLQSGKRKQKREEMIMSAHTRAKKLLSAGFSLEDIARAAIEAEEDKQMRLHTLQNLGWDSVAGFLSMTARTPFDLLSGVAKTTGGTLKKAERIPVLGPAGKVVVTGVGVGAKAVVSGVGAGAGAVLGVGTAAGRVVGSLTRRMSRSRLQ